jgi:hypothetical protein
MPIGPVLQLRHSEAVQLHAGDLGEHLGELGLHELETRDRLAELDAVLRVLQRDVVGGEGVAERLPGRAAPRRSQHPGGVAEGLGLRSLLSVGHERWSRVTSGCHTARLPSLQRTEMKQLEATEAQLRAQIAELEQQKVKTRRPGLHCGAGA